jgi:AAA domain-containing protein
MSEDDSKVLAFVQKAAEQAKNREAREQKRADKRFSITRLKEISINRADTGLIKGLLPRTGVGLIWGEPKTFKTFWTLDLTLHIARDDVQEYRGLRCKTAPVVYCAFEGGGGMGARIAAYRQHHGIADDADIGFALINASVDLISEHQQLIASIEEQLGVAPGVIVLDTLNQSLVGSESSDQDMAAYLAAAEAISRRFDCLVLIVHHCGHDHNRYRGHSSLGGTIVVEIAIRKAGADTMISTVQCAREFEAGKTLTHAMVKVDLGVDVDGDPISSLVCVQAQGWCKAEQAVKWPPSLALLRQAMTDAIIEHGRTIRPFGAEGPEVKAVAAERVKEAFLERHPEQQQKVKAKKFGRHLEKAVGEDLVTSRTIHGQQTLWFARSADEALESTDPASAKTSALED